MIAITRVAGKPHITPRLDAMWHRGIAGTESGVFEFFESFKAEISSNNKIRIRSGIGMLQGRFFAVEPSTYDEVSIGNGTQGEKRIDLIVARWTVDDENNVQDGDWHVIQGTPTTGTPAVPAHTTGDLDAGDLIADMPMFQVELNGVNITAIKKVYKTWALPIAQGGTGKTTAAEARAALGITGNIISDVTQTNNSRIMRTIKYENGDMEQYMWGSNISMTFVANGNRFMDFVTFNTLEEFANPSKIFIYGSCESNAGIAFLYANAFENDKKSAMCYFDCPTAGTRTIENLTMYAKGRWKQ